MLRMFPLLLLEVINKELYRRLVFERALISASSLGLASFFGSIISHFRSYYNTITLYSQLYLLLGYKPSLSFIA
jgi:hypothetical protein